MWHRMAAGSGPPGRGRPGPTGAGRGPPGPVGAGRGPPGFPAWVFPFIISEHHFEVGGNISAWLVVDVSCYSCHFLSAPPKLSAYKYSSMCILCFEVVEFVCKPAAKL